MDVPQGDASLVPFEPSLEESLEALLQADSNAPQGIVPPLPTGTAADATTGGWSQEEWDTWGSWTPYEAAGDAVVDFTSVYTQQARHDVDIERDRPYLVPGVVLPSLITSPPLPAETLPATSNAPISYGASSSSSGTQVVGVGTSKRKAP